MSALTHHLPVGFAGDCFYASVSVVRCWLVVNDSTSRTAKNFDPLIKQCVHFMLRVLKTLICLVIVSLVVEFW
jgi:hypothetical protein